ncbi:unnamed protein product [Choristocarpus tenellus]
MMGTFLFTGKVEVLTGPEDERSNWTIVDVGFGKVALWSMHNDVLLGANPATAPEDEQFYLRKLDKGKSGIATTAKVQAQAQFSEMWELIGIPDSEGEVVIRSIYGTHIKDSSQLNGGFDNGQYNSVVTSLKHSFPPRSSQQSGYTWARAVVNWGDLQDLDLMSWRPSS